MMSSLVDVKCIRLPTSLLNSVGSTVDPSSSLLNFKLVINGVGVLFPIRPVKYF